MSRIPKIKNLDQLNDTLERNAHVFVDFYASWCNPCKKIEPSIIALSKEYTHVYFCKVNVDQADDISKQYHIKSMPTFILFTKEGDLKTTGANVEKIVNLLKTTI
jgi:thioredoxin 1